MKKLIAGALLLSASSMTFAQGPGCGVGAMIWKGQSGIAPHVLAATTNGAASQTVSMTLGIVGCETNASIQSMASLIDARGDAVAHDIAVGQGENLDAIASSLRIPQDQWPEFRSLLQTNFESIFPSTDVRSSHVVAEIVRILEQDERFKDHVA